MSVFVHQRVQLLPLLSQEERIKQLETKYAHVFSCEDSHRSVGLLRVLKIQCRGEAE